ncbi:hypothetical protein D3C78_1589720 [compost metagenome]
MPLLLPLKGLNSVCSPFWHMGNTIHSLEERKLVSGLRDALRAIDNLTLSHFFWQDRAAPVNHCLVRVALKLRTFMFNAFNAESFSQIFSRLGTELV